MLFTAVTLLIPFIIFAQTPTVSADDDEITVTTSVLSFVLRGPKSAVADENDDDDNKDDYIFVLVCRTYNPVIKTFDRHHVENRIVLDVQCKHDLRYYSEILVSILFLSISPGNLSRQRFSICFFFFVALNFVPTILSIFRQSSVLRQKSFILNTCWPRVDRSSGNMQQFVPTRFVSTLGAKNEAKRGEEW